MQIFNRDLVLSARRAALTLSAVLAFGSGCDANHVLGSEDQTGAAGAAGTLGAAGAGAAGLAATDASGDGGGAAVDTDAAGLEPDGSVTVPDGLPEVGPLGPPQSWTGYIENFMFPSGSDTIKFTFATDANGQVAGQIVLGQGPPPPLATDANVGYPPALDNYTAFAENPFGVTRYTAEGFTYVIGSGTFASSRLRFEVPAYQLWADWCALQTSASCSSAAVAEDPSAQTCNEVSPSTGQSVSVECGKALLCALPISPCDCSGNGPCKLTTRAMSFGLDLFVTGETASGSVDLAMGTAHFTKDP